METTFKIARHTNRDVDVVEVYQDGVVVAVIFPRDPNDGGAHVFRIISKHEIVIEKTPHILFFHLIKS